jgi:hypothetical protein
MDCGAAVPTVSPEPSAELVVAQLILPEWPEQQVSLPRQNPLRRTVSQIASAVEWLFGTATLVLGLAILATLPVVQFLSLGYLLEVSGRVARSGRLRDGFVGVRKAARVGGIALCIWLLLWPLRAAASMWEAARLIDPSSPATRGWGIALGVMAVLVGLHVASALLRGGRVRSFLVPRPIHFVRQVLSRGAYRRAVDGLWEFGAGLRLPYYFWLGLRGFAGAMIWLAIPVSLMTLATRLPEGLGTLAGIVGGLLLALVAVHLPLLQTRFAAQGRFAAMFSLGENRRTVARAPVAYFLALLFTLTLAIPLYLLKIELLPQETAWLASLVFVGFALPARLLTGWACSRAVRRGRPRHFVWRWASRLGMLPLAGIYVLFAWFSQFTSWYGVWSLYEQHAFLVPAPFWSF